MKKVIDGAMKHGKFITTHLRKHHKKYLFGTFGGFALVKMVLLFLGLSPVLNIKNISASNDSTVVLNAENLQTICRYDEGVPSVIDCKNQGITDIEAGAFGKLADSNTTVRAILLNENELTELGAGVFNGIKTLTGNQFSISLADNNLTHIADEAFAGLKIDGYISFAGNTGLKVNKNTFEGAIFTGHGSNKILLDNMDLTDDNIEDINSLLEIPNLNQLWLRKNRITNIGKLDLYRSTSLGILELSHNNITSIDNLDFSTTSIYNLNISYNQIFDISNDTLQYFTGSINIAGNCLSDSEVDSLADILGGNNVLGWNKQKLCLFTEYTPTYVSNSRTSGNVDASLTFTGKDQLVDEYRYLLNGITPLNFSGNATKHFNVTDLSGYSYGERYTYVYEDDEEYTETTITGFIMNYPEDGRFPATVTWIDNTPPVCGEWSYSPSLDIRSTGITATLSNSYDNDDGAGIATSGGTCPLNTNGVKCKVDIVDLVGNTKECRSARPEKIDKEGPTVNFSLTSGTGSSFTITISGDDNPSGLQEEGQQQLSYKRSNGNSTCDEENWSGEYLINNQYCELHTEGLPDGTYYLCIKENSFLDKAGNGNEATSAGPFVLYNTAPTLEEIEAIPQRTSDTTPSYTFSSTEAGNITYNGSCSGDITQAISGENTTTFNELQPGTYSDCTIMVTNAMGNNSNILTIPEFTIQTETPECTVSYNPTQVAGRTTGDVTASLDCPTGVTITSAGGNTHLFTANGTFTFMYKDAAQNQGSTLANVTWIDKDDPNLQGITTIGTTGNRTPSYTFTSTEPGNITYNGSCSGNLTQAISGENTTTFYELEYGAYSDCSITVTDVAGNSSTLNIPSFTITEHNSPTTLIRWGAHTVPSMWKQDITVDIVRYQGAAGGVMISTTNDINSVARHLGYTPVTTGAYTMIINNEDQNGRYVCAFGTTGGTTETICSDYPIKIDRSAPSLQLISPANGANFNSGDTVTLQWSGYDRPSGISGYTLTITDPDNNTETYYYDSGTTSKSYTINKSGTWQRSVAANDIVGHTGYETRTFTVPYSGGNNESGGESLSGFNLISPALGDQINLGENVILSWLSGTINSGYIREVKNISGTIIASGYTTSLTVTINSELFTTGAYSWSVKDIASETTKSIPLFYIVDSQNSPDLKVSQFEFDEIKDAKLDEYYQSNTITIKGLSNNWYSYAYLKDGIGALYINDRFVGTNGFVKNGDEIYIEMKASDQYNKTVKTNFIVGGGINAVSGDFKITTKNGINSRDDSSLTPMQKLWGIIFVDSLVEMYQYDEEKLATFLSTFMQLLQDKSDYYAREIQEAENDGDENLAKENKLYKDAIDFLYVTVKYRYDNIEVEDRTVYIAPNGKQYLVEYDENRMAYTSPDFARPKYFPTWELFTNHIDMNNPAIGKWGIVGNVITTHNGKVYTIYETNGKWTSSNFKTAKYFDTKEDIINHILANNPASSWNHTVDPDFEQVTYTAPNGKVYKIFRTSSKGNNPDMYSSYNFVNAKYFTSLEAAKKFIDQNNKK